MSDFFHPDRNLGTKTQKNLPHIPGRGLLRFRFQKASCCRRARLSRNRLRRVRKRRRLDLKMTRGRLQTSRAAARPVLYVTGRSGNHIPIHIFRVAAAPYCDLLRIRVTWVE